MNHPQELLNYDTFGVRYMAMYDYIAYWDIDSTFVYFLIATPFIYEERHEDTFLSTDMFHQRNLRILPIFGNPLFVRSDGLQYYYKVAVPIVVIGGRFGIALTPSSFGINDYQVGEMFPTKEKTGPENIVGVSFYKLLFSCDKCKHEFAFYPQGKGELLVYLYKTICPKCFKTDISLLDISVVKPILIDVKEESVKPTNWVVRMLRRFWNFLTRKKD